MAVQLAFELLSQNPWPADSWFLPVESSVYSFESAFYYIDYPWIYPNQTQDYYSYFWHYPLWEEVCTSSDSINYDCYSSCPGHAFDSRFHLATCASISLLVETDAALDFYNVTDPSHVQVVTGRNRTGPRRVVTQDLETTADETSRNIWNCLSDKCQGLPDCKATLSYYDSDASYSARLRENGSYLVNQLCSALPLQLDGDIGGIGVYISYWIHSCLTLLLFILSLLLKGMVQYLLRLKNEDSGMRTTRFAENRLMRIGKFAENRLTSLNAALVEFHKAQCFFTIAINIAAIKVFKRGGLDPQSLEQIYNNYVFIKIVAISGYLPVTLTLWNVHIIDKTYWFLVFLSTTSIAFAAGTLGVLKHYFHPTENDLKKLDDVYQNNGPESCQGKQPWAYCYTDTYTYKVTQSLGLNSMANGILAFCCVILFLLVIGKLKDYPGFRRRSVSIWRKTEPARTRIGNIALVQKTTTLCHNLWTVTTTCVFRHPSQRYNSTNGSPFSPVVANPRKNFSSVTYTVRERIHRHATRVGHFHLVYQILKVLISCLFIGLFAYFFSIYLEALRIFATKQAYKDTWSFGQVVALLVWVPPIVEYIHCELRGIRAAFEHRLLAPYHVTTQQTDDWPINRKTDGLVTYGHTEDTESGGKTSTFDTGSSGIPLTAAASPPGQSKQMEMYERNGFASERTTHVSHDGRYNNGNSDSDGDEEEAQDIVHGHGRQGFGRLDLDFDTHYHGAGGFRT